jgi:hypothetical protein
MKMKLNEKKLIALFLVISLMMLSGNLLAKARRGSDLVVTKKDGQQIIGELIAIKEKSLLLKDAKSGADVSVNGDEIRIIRIVKKSKVGKGALYGTLIGGGSGALLGFASGDDPPGFMSWTASQKAGLLGISLGVIGLLSGTIGGALSGIDRIIKLEGKNDIQIRLILEKLRQNARIRGY